MSSLSSRNLVGEKDEHEKVDEEVEKQLDESPTDKPPRDDRSRDYIDTGDEDIDEDPDTSQDDDLSMNYKDIGGSAVDVARRWASEGSRPFVVSDPVSHSDTKLGEIVGSAVDLVGGTFAGLRRDDPELALRVALDSAIHAVGGRRFYRAVGTPTYEELLDRAAEKMAEGSQ